MTTIASKILDYRDQIQRCVRAMALGVSGDMRPFLSPDMPVDRVRMFVEDNHDKRIGKIRDQVEMLSEVFEDLGELITEFVGDVPLAAYDTGCSDSVRFLKWLPLGRLLSAEQQDYMTCQFARQEVESIARHNRLGHVRFQELWRLVPTLRSELVTNRMLRVVLNPIRVSTIFQTNALLSEDEEVPYSVMFFASGPQIRTSVIDAAAAQRLETLASHGPLTLEDWRQFDRSVTRNELMDFCTDAAEIGLVAFG